MTNEEKVKSIFKDTYVQENIHNKGWAVYNSKRLLGFGKDLGEAWYDATFNPEVKEKYGHPLDSIEPYHT